MNTLGRDQALTTLLALALLSSNSAQAEPAPGSLYVAGTAGIAVTDDVDFADRADPTTTGHFGFDTGFALSGAVGVALHRGFRGELELAYRKTDFDEITVTGVGSGAIGGELETLSGMLIGYYDFHSGMPLRPYLSAGLGFAHHDAEVLIPGDSDSADDTVFAYQFGVGVSYSFDESWAITVGYRYLGTADPEFGDLDTEFDGHDIRIGFRHSF